MISALPAVGVRANRFNLEGPNFKTENTSKQLNNAIGELNKIQKTPNNLEHFDLGIQASLQIATEDLYLYAEPLLAIGGNLIAAEELSESLATQYHNETGVELLKASDFFERLKQPDAQNIQINLELKAGSRGKKAEALQRAQERGLTEQNENAFFKFLLKRTYNAGYNQHLSAPSSAIESFHILRTIQMLEINGLSHRTHILSMCPDLLQILEGLNTTIRRSLVLRAEHFDMRDPWQSMQDQNVLTIAAKAKVNDLSLEAQFFTDQLSDKEPNHQQIEDLRENLLHTTGKNSQGFSVWSVDDPKFAKDLIGSFGSWIDFIVSNRAIPVASKLKNLQLLKRGLT